MEALNEPKVQGRQALRRSVSLADLERITVPTLLIAGDEDVYAPPPLMAVMSSRIPNGHLVTVSPAGHSGYWEQPEQWNHHAIGFLREVVGGRSRGAR